jgi:hypothetical protein
MQLLLVTVLTVTVTISPLRCDALSVRSLPSYTTAVAPWVGTAIATMNAGLDLIADNVALKQAIDNVITDSGTSPYSIYNLLTDIFGTVTAAVNFEMGNSSIVAQELSSLFTDIVYLVVGSVNGKVLASDIGRVVCDAEALEGSASNCDTTELTDAINKLVVDATNYAEAATIINDAFGIASAAVNLGSAAGYISPTVATATKELFSGPIYSLFLQIVAQLSR